MKAEEARSETERIMAQQAADLAAKKADMNRRDAEREAVKATKARAVPSWAHHSLCVCGNAGISVCVCESLGALLSVFEPESKRYLTKVKCNWRGCTCLWCFWAFCLIYFVCDISQTQKNDDRKVQAQKRSLLCTCAPSAAAGVVSEQAGCS